MQNLMVPQRGERLQHVVHTTTPRSSFCCTLLHVNHDNRRAFSTTIVCAVACCAMLQAENTTPDNCHMASDVHSTYDQSFSPLITSMTTSRAAYGITGLSRRNTTRGEKLTMAAMNVHASGGWPLYNTRGCLIP